MRHRSKTFLGGTVWSSCSDFKIHLVTCWGLRNSSWDFGLRSLQSHAARAPETRITKFYTNENNKKLKRCLIQSITLFSRSSRLRPKMFPCLFILVLMRFQYFQCALDIQPLVSVNKAESSRIHFASGSLNFDNIRWGCLLDINFTLSVAKLWKHFAY